MGISPIINTIKGLKVFGARCYAMTEGIRLEACWGLKISDIIQVIKPAKFKSLKWASLALLSGS